jgi:hypothetical protein
MAKSACEVLIGVLVVRHVPRAFWGSTGGAIEWKCSCGTVNRSILSPKSTPLAFICSADNED